MTTVSTSSGGIAAIGASDQDLPVGSQVGDYQIEGLIGKGGFGTVYRASHPVIGKVVAIKVLARKWAADEAVVSRFVAEARSVNQISHRNIIDIFLFGQLPDGRHYYVMEYLDGEPLDRYIERYGPMPLPEALPHLRAIARALDAAHAKGIAHRDLKPENILLARDPDGDSFPKLLDFGIAKLLAPKEEVLHHTGTGVPIGTPYYMSPEQCRGRDVDHRTDIYSFGIVAYRLLTGAYPFEGADYMELLTKQVNADAPPPSSKNAALPATVDAAIAWMMRKDPDQRPRTVLEGVLALDPSAVTDQDRRTSRPSMPPATPGPSVPADAFAVTTAQAPSSPARSRPTVWIGAALVLVCSAAGVMLVMNHGGAAEPATSSTASADKANTEPLLPPTTTFAAGSATPPPKVDQVPSTVAITITKVPAHATTTYAGTRVELPGTIQLPRGDQIVELVIEAPGFEPRTLPVHPDHAQEIPAPLHRRPVAHPAANTPHERGDIIHSDSIFGAKP